MNTTYICPFCNRDVKVTAPPSKAMDRWEELKKWLEISRDAAYARRDPWTVYINVWNKMEELEKND